MKDTGGRPPIYESAEELQAEINAYFEQFRKKGARRYLNESRPTITGLILYCGFESRTSFYDMERRDGFMYTIKRARAVIENIYEDVLLTAKNAAGPIFALKNIGAWREEQNINVSTTRDAVAELFPEELLPGQPKKDEPDNKPEP